MRSVIHWNVEILLADSDLLTHLNKTTNKTNRLEIISSHIIECLRSVLSDSHAYIDEDRSFIELGLDSLLLTKMLRALRSMLNGAVSLTTADLFNNPSVKGMSGYLYEKIALLLKWDNDSNSSIRHKPEMIFKRDYERIVIVGVSCRFPGGAQNDSDYHKLLTNGSDAMTTVPVTRWNHQAYYSPTIGKAASYYCPFFAFILENIWNFDHNFFGIPKVEGKWTDPQQRLLLETSWCALESANIVPRQLHSRNVGVYVGTMESEFAIMMRQVKANNRPDGDEYYAVGSHGSASAGRLSFFYGTRGNCTTVDTACSSSLVTTKMAAAHLREENNAEYTLTAGMSLMLSPTGAVERAQLRMLSPHGHSQSFDRHADGYARGEGVGVMIMSKSSLLSPTVVTLADVSAVHVNQDGASIRLSAPSGTAQQELMETCLQISQLKPTDINVIEAHGTGTPLGDPIEIDSLGKIYGCNRWRDYLLTIGTAKASIGHLEGAAGIAGLIKALLIIKHCYMPKHRNCAAPNREIDFNVLMAQVPYEGVSIEEQINATVSSFGVSGTNAHAILSQCSVTDVDDEQTVSSTQPLMPVGILPLSAKSPTALHALAERYRQMIASDNEWATSNISDIMCTAACHREHFQCRLACTAIHAVTCAKALSSSSSRAPARSTHPRIAYQFTGQGTDYAYMMHGLYAHLPRFRELVDLCAGIVASHRMRFTLFDDSPSNDRVVSQAHMFVVQYALGKCLQEIGIVPVAVMGHSFGEYTAAALVGLISLEDGVMLACERGRLMSCVEGRGCMLSVSTAAHRLQPILQQMAYVHLGYHLKFRTCYECTCSMRDDSMSVAARNSSWNTVASGDQATVHRVELFMSALEHRCRIVNDIYAGPFSANERARCRRPDANVPRHLVRAELTFLCFRATSRRR